MLLIATEAPSTEGAVTPVVFSYKQFVISLAGLGRGLGSLGLGISGAGQ